MNTYLGTKTLESMSQAEFYNKWTLSKFEKYLKGNILEVGAGIGNFTSTLSKYGKLVAIDINYESLNKFMSRKNKKMSIGFGDIEKAKYFFKDRSFDTVVCLNVLEHIKDDANALVNMFKLLKRGGILILLVPIYTYLYGEIDRSIGHFRRYDPKDLIEKLTKLNGRILLHKKLNFLGAIGWFIAGRIFKNTQIEKRKIKMFNIISPLSLMVEDLIEPPFGTSILVVIRKDKS